MSAELWDLLDEQRQPLGRTMRRGDKIPAGCFHTCVEVWTINRDKSILLTLRHPAKELFPKLWECTGGSAVAGESSLDAAQRELKEETGLCVRQEQLILLGTAVTMGCIFFDTYAVRCDFALADIRLQPEETVAAQLVRAERLDELIRAGRLAPTIAERLALYRAEFDQLLEMEIAT